MSKLKYFRRAIRVFVETVIFIYCKIVYRVKIVGRENVPKKGALIFCGNHRSYLDPPLMVVTAGRRNIHFIAKQELRKGAFIFLGKRFKRYSIT